MFVIGALLLVDVPRRRRLFVHAEQPAQPARTHQHRAGLPQRPRRPEGDQHRTTPSANAIIDRLQQVGASAGSDQRRRRVGSAVRQVHVRCRSRESMQARVIDDRRPGDDDHLVRQGADAGRRHPAGVVGRRVLRVRRPVRRQRDAAQRRSQPVVRRLHHDARRRAGRAGRRQTGDPPTRRRRPGRQGHRRRASRHTTRRPPTITTCNCCRLRSTTWPKRCRTVSNATLDSPATSATNCARR